MGRQGHDDAIRAIESSTDLVELASAIGSLIDDPSTRPEELLPALVGHGFVAEQAAIALHRLTQTPWLREAHPILSARTWRKRLKSIRKAVG